jgi:hypothetical protein
LFIGADENFAFGVRRRSHRDSFDDCSPPRKGHPPARRMLLTLGARKGRRHSFHHRLWAFKNIIIGGLKILYAGGIQTPNSQCLKSAKRIKN